MSGWDSFRDETAVIRAPGYFNQADTARQGFHLVFTYQNYWSSSGGITGWLPFSEQKRLVEDRLRFSNVQYEVFPGISRSLADIG